MSVLDIILILITIIIAVRCVIRGFIEEFLSMAAIIFGIAGAVFFSGPVGSMIEKYFQLSMWSHVIAFLACFIVIYLIIKILEGIIHKIFDKLNLEKLDKALGLILGLMEAFLVVSVIIFLLSWFKWLPFIDIEKLLAESFIAGFIQPLLIPVIQPQAMLNPSLIIRMYV